MSGEVGWIASTFFLAGIGVGIGAAMAFFFTFIVGDDE